MPTAPFADYVKRPGTGADIPKQLATDVIDDIRTRSTALKLGHVVQTDTKDSRIGILTSDVEAYWLSGDVGLKSVSAPAWESKSVMAEELAVVIPIPDAVVDDADMPLWDEVRPLVARAFARRIDDAILFGNSRPASWSPSLVETATAATATVTATDDPASDALAAAEIVAGQELTPSAIAVRNGWEWNAAIRRTESFNLSPITENSPFPLSLAGLPIANKPVTWDKTKANAIIADFGQCVVGIRQDLTMTFHRDGVITDENGKVLMNLLTQDSTAMRAVMRVGYHLRRPVIGKGNPTVPVAIVTPA